MKIFDTSPFGNELAELENGHYIKLALDRIREHVEWLKTTKKTAQAVLAHIDILLMFARRFPVNSNLLIRKKEVKEWEEVFYDWYKRCGGRIPTKFREGIKESADDLFKELSNYGH